TTIRLGFRQVKGLSRSAAENIVIQRALQTWVSLEDFLQRTHIPKDQRRVLAKIGALNALAGHRRSALWQVEHYLDEEDLFSWAARRTNVASVSENLPPLSNMNAIERLRADYEGLDLTTGKHPMAYVRAQLSGALTAYDLLQRKHGDQVEVAGLVVCRQRPGTAKGNLFISLEDETGISNTFVPSPMYEKHRLTITQESFLRIRGRLQKVDNVTSIYTEHVEPLEFATKLQPQSHDFH
ncbi:MAG: OB-fold nucleic acid binding domain-containing protein, partial [Verrucomicrobiota bacterium]